jgi:dephospho-CoA kinase
VWCRPEQQVERLRARGINEIEAERRISAQLPLEEKLKHATVSINCSGTVEETRAQVDALAAKLRHGSPTG